MSLRKLGAVICFTAFLGAFLACLSVPLSVQGQAIDSDAASRVGLTVHWQSNFRVDRFRDKISDFNFHVHDNESISYYEILYSGNRETVGFDDLNPRGVSFREIYPEEPGRGAKEWSEFRKEILEAEGKTEVQIKLITTPKTTLFALTDTGTIHAIDAETGSTRWVKKIGKPGSPSVGLAVTNKHVVVVRGSQVYALDIKNGEFIWQQQCNYSPGGGVAASDKYAYVTGVDGRLQILPLENQGIPQAFISSTGPALFDPNVTASTVSWTTEKGFFNVAKSDDLVFQYRLKSDDGFRSSATGVGEFLIATSAKGTVYGIAENFGDLVWEFAVGENLDKEPIALGSNVALIITSSSQLLALDVGTGKIVEGWPKRVRGVEEYIGVGQDVMYFSNGQGRLLALRRDSGAEVGSFEIGNDKIVIPNTVTDRLYIADTSGAITCLRETVNINPIVISEEFEIGSKAAKKDSMKKESGRVPNGKEGKSPFDKDAKPESEKSDDPFGEPGGTEKTDDPFAEKGGMEEKEDDDPFGGEGGGETDEEEDDDPFGND